MQSLPEGLALCLQAVAWIMSQQPSSSGYSQPQARTVFSTVLHSRSTSLTNQMPPLAPLHWPTHHCCPATAHGTSWAVLFTIWEATCHPPGLSLPRSAGRRGPSVLPMGGADPHGCPLTRHSPELTTAPCHQAVWRPQGKMDKKTPVLSGAQTGCSRNTGPRVDTRRRRLSA